MFQPRCMIFGLANAGEHTWTAPPNVTEILVEMLGCSGSGGAAPGGIGGGNGGGGGGGGGYASSIVSVIPGNTYPFSLSSVGSGLPSFWNGGVVQASGGTSASDSTAGVGGNIAQCIGQVVTGGGNGANGASGYSGGGGAAGSKESNGEHANGILGGEKTDLHLGGEGGPGRDTRGQGYWGGTGGGSSGNFDTGLSVRGGQTGRIRIRYNYQFDYGSGTPEDPYQIWNIYDFDKIKAYVCPFHAEDFVNTHFKQMQDIDFLDFPNDYNYIPIGWHYQPQYPQANLYWRNDSFMSTYDGNNFVIKNHKIDVNTQWFETYYENEFYSMSLALFPECHRYNQTRDGEPIYGTGSKFQEGDPCLRNIKLDNLVMNAWLDRGFNTSAAGYGGYSDSGGLCGLLSYGFKIINCHVRGNVRAGWKSGGIVGIALMQYTWVHYAIFETEIINCSFIGSVGGEWNVGGLIGELYGGTVHNCYAISRTHYIHCLNPDYYHSYSVGGHGGLIGIATAATYSLGIPIASAEDLQAINSQDEHTFAAGTEWEQTTNGGLDKSYIQVCDIDLSGYDNWTPIGDWENNYFYGCYNGSNYKIIGMKMSHTQGTGLFGYVGIPNDMTADKSCHIEIRNVRLENINVNGVYYTGGLIGYLYRIGCHENKTAHIYQCSVDNSIIENSFAVTCEYDTGMLIGHIDCWELDKGKIEQCWAKGRLQGSGDIGGLVGVSYVIQFKDCFFRGELHQEGAWGACVYGGIAGMAAQSTFENCYTQALYTANEGENMWIGPITGGSGSSIGDIISCYYTYKTDFPGNYNLVTNGEQRTPVQMTYPEHFNNTYINWDFSTIWQSDTGGVNDHYPLLRSTSNPITTGVTKCWNYSYVRVDDINRDMHIDGVAGCIGNIYGGITIDCYSFTEVDIDVSIIATFYSHPNNVGGFTGFLDWGAYVRNCFTVSTLAFKNTDGIEIGGFVGFMYSGALVESCYYNMEVSGITIDDERGSPRTTEEMTYMHDKNTTYIDWGFGNPWFITPEYNWGYPCFIGWEIGLPLIQADLNIIFNGYLNGNWKVLYNGSINLPENSSIGIFTSLGESSRVKKLGIENLTVHGENQVGSLVGSNEGLIELTYVDKQGNVEGLEDVGSFVGHNIGIIVNCYARGAVIGVSNRGGFVGFNEGGVILKCYSTGNVT